MKRFLLKILVPDGLIFADNVYQVCVRSVEGDVSILAQHTPYLTVLESGKCKILKKIGDKPIIYECKNGFLIVTKDSVDINLESCVLKSQI